MNADDSITWILRILAAIFVTGVFVTLLLFVSPQVNVASLHAEQLGARILYDGGFSQAPGRIDVQRFTQETATNDYVAPNSALHQNLGARAWVTTLEGEPLLDEIIYHEPGYVKLRPFVDAQIGDASSMLWTVPVVVVEGNTRQNAILHVEVLYNEE